MGVLCSQHRSLDKHECGDCAFPLRTPPQSLHKPRTLPLVSPWRMPRHAQPGHQGASSRTEQNAPASSPACSCNGLQDSPSPRSGSQARVSGAQTLWLLKAPGRGPVGVEGTQALPEQSQHAGGWWGLRAARQNRPGPGGGADLLREGGCPPDCTAGTGGNSRNTATSPKDTA